MKTIKGKTVQLIQILLPNKYTVFVQGRAQANFQVQYCLGELNTHWWP